MKVQEKREEKTGKMILASAFLAVSAIALGAYAILNQRQFGQALNVIMRSPHYVDGEFRNLSSPFVKTDVLS